MSLSTLGHLYKFNTGSFQRNQSTWPHRLRARFSATPLCAPRSPSWGGASRYARTWAHRTAPRRRNRWFLPLPRSEADGTVARK